MRLLVRSLTALLVISFALWSAALAFLYFNQESMVFPVPPVKPVPAGDTGFEPLSLKTPDGENLNLLVHSADPGEEWVVVFHGNGGDVVQVLPEARRIADYGFGVLVAEYRGYNNGTGVPSQNGLYIDALTAFDHLRTRSDARIHLYAHSLGTAMAIHVAQHRDAAGVALLAPFDSVLSVAQDRYPILPLRPFLKHPFPSADKISEVEETMVIYHGNQDQVVPIENGRALHAAAPQTARFVEVDGVMHNDLFERGITDEAARFFQNLTE